jgi:large subunit ribosomal protein L20
MPRAKRGFKARRRRNRVLKAASGFRAGRRTMYRRAMEAVRHAWMHAYVGRKQKKRTMRRLWIVRINAAARHNSISYSRLMDGCNKAGIELDRKVLADLALVDPEGFTRVVETARASL